MDINEYKKKIEQERKELEEIKKMNLPPPATKWKSPWTSIFTINYEDQCPNCKRVLNPTKLAGIQVWKCNCGYVYTR